VGFACLIHLGRTLNCGMHHFVPVSLESPGRAVKWTTPPVARACYYIEFTPAFLNSGKHSSRFELPPGWHGFKTNDKLLLVFTCIANRVSHLSTSVHRREAGISSTGVALEYLKVMEGRAGAERIQDRGSARRAEREPE